MNVQTFRSAVAASAGRSASISSYERKRRAHPKLSGPWDTVPSKTACGSTCKGNAYGTHGSTLPKLGTYVTISESQYYLPGESYSLKGQSSPGVLHPGQHASYATRQIPQTSNSSFSSSLLPVSHLQDAIACQCLTVTFMACTDRENEDDGGGQGSREGAYRLLSTRLPHVHVPGRRASVPLFD